MFKQFHLEQAEAFKDYASKFKIEHRGDLLSLFITWAESKELLEKDKLIIWKLVIAYYRKRL